MQNMASSQAPEQQYDYRHHLNHFDPSVATVSSQIPLPSTLESRDSLNFNPTALPRDQMPYNPAPLQRDAPLYNPRDQFNSSTLHPRDPQQHQHHQYNTQITLEHHDPSLSTYATSIREPPHLYNPPSLTSLQQSRDSHHYTSPPHLPYRDSSSGYTPSHIPRDPSGGYNPTTLPNRDSSSGGTYSASNMIPRELSGGGSSAYNPHHTRHNHHHHHNQHHNLPRTASHYTTTSSNMSLAPLHLQNNVSIHSHNGDDQQHLELLHSLSQMQIAPSVAVSSANPHHRPDSAASSGRLSFNSNNNRLSSLLIQPAPPANRNPPPSERTDANANLYIRNLPSFWNVRDLTDFYSHFGGEVCSACILTDPHTKKSKCVGFVRFGTTSQATRAASATNGVHVQGGGPLVARFAHVKSREEKRHERQLKKLQFEHMTTGNIPIHLPYELVEQVQKPISHFKQTLTLDQHRQLTTSPTEDNGDSDREYGLVMDLDEDDDSTDADADIVETSEENDLLAQAMTEFHEHQKTKPQQPKLPLQQQKEEEEDDKPSPLSPQTVVSTPTQTLFVPTPPPAQDQISSCFVPTTPSLSSTTTTPVVQQENGINQQHFQHLLQRCALSPCSLTTVVFCNLTFPDAQGILKTANCHGAVKSLHFHTLFDGEHDDRIGAYIPTPQAAATTPSTPQPPRIVAYINFYEAPAAFAAATQLYGNLTPYSHKLHTELVPDTALPVNSTLAYEHKTPAN